MASPPSRGCPARDIATRSPVGQLSSLTKLASLQSPGTIFVACETTKLPWFYLDLTHGG